MGHLLKMGMNNLFLSLIRGQKEKKEKKKNSKPFTERNVMIISAYLRYPLNPFVLFYAISVFKKSLC